MCPAVAAHHALHFESAFHRIVFLGVLYRFDPAPFQPQAGDDADAAHGHRRPGDHRVEHEAPQRVEDPRGDGHAHEVVDESPEEVLPDGPDGQPRQTQHRGNLPQVGRENGHAGRLEGDVAAVAQGDPHVGPGQRGAVVDAVAGHGDDVASALQVADVGLLLAGQHPGLYAGDSGGPSHGGGRGLLVARQHVDLDAAAAELRDGLARSLAQAVRNGRYGQCTVLVGEPDDAVCLRGPAACPGVEPGVDGNAALLEQPAAARAVFASGEASRDAASGVVGELPGGLVGTDSRSGEMRDECLGERVLRAALEGHEARGLGFGPDGPMKGRYGGASLCQRARLVQDDGIHAAGRLERFGVLDQDARPGPAPDARHDGRRGSQPQGAGAGDDQHGDQRQHAVCKSLCRVEKEPRPEREQGHGDDRRHEDRGDAVRQPLHGGPAALRILHQADDLCQHRAFADLFGTVAQ
jgi:hypothetical protein